MSIKIQTVALAGASGNLGPHVLSALLSSGKFSVTVITRQGSKHQFPATVKVVEVDYDSLESLTTAFKGQDALVSTLGFLPTPAQLKIVDAAVAAGVKRIIPSEYGGDLGNHKVQQLPTSRTKVEVQDHIEEVIRAHPGFSWSAVRCMAFLDWGLEYKFLLDVSERKPAILNGGDIHFSATTLDTVAAAVVGVLKYSAETANRAVYVHDMVVTQNQLLAVAQKLTPGETWTPVQVDNSKQVETSNEAIRTGTIDGMKTMGPYLWQSIVDEGYGGKFEEVDNDLLGLKPVKEDIIEEILKPLLAKSQI